MRVVVPMRPGGGQPRCTVATLEALGVPGVSERDARTGLDGYQITYTVTTLPEHMNDMLADARFSAESGV